MTDTLTPAAPPALTPEAPPAAPGGSAIGLPTPVTAADDLDTLLAQVETARRALDRADAVLAAARHAQPTAADAFRAQRLALDPVTLFLSSLPAVPASVVEAARAQVEAAEDAHGEAHDLNQKAPAKRQLEAARAYHHALAVLHDTPALLPAAEADAEAAEQALADVRGRIPALLQQRREAEDREDGAGWQDAEAALRGLPRKVGTAAAARVTAHVRYLALVHDLARANRARLSYECEADERERRDLLSQYHRHDARRAGEAGLTPADLKMLTADLRTVGLRLEAVAVQARHADDAATAARIRAAFHDESLDFGTPGTIGTAAQAAAKKAEAQAHKGIITDGK